MTDKHPYYSLQSTKDILLAIVNNKPPADVATLNIPNFVIDILERCWDSSPEARPTMSVCQKALEQERLDVAQ